MKSEPDLMQIEETSSGINPFDYLPAELVAYLGQFLDSKAYINFALASTRLYQTLTNNKSIKSYDPLLSIIFEVSLYYVHQVFGKNFTTADHTPIALIKKIIALYKEVKDIVLITEIEIDKDILIPMLDCHLAEMDVDAKQALKFDFLPQLFGNYFKLRSYFIFDAKQWSETILADSVKFNFLITCINQDEQGSLKLQSFTENIEKVEKNPVAYIHAKQIFFAARKMNNANLKERALVSAKRHCLTSYEAGAKNAVFLYLSIYNYQKSNQLPMEISPEDLAKLEKEAAELLSIEKSEKSIFEIVPETLLEALCLAPTKAIKIFKKLLINNAIDELQTLGKELPLWPLIRASHTLEFLNGFHGTAKKLQELAPVLKTICNSPNAFIIGEILREEALLPAFPEQWKTDDFIQQLSKFTKSGLWRGNCHYRELKQYYPLLSFVEFSSEKTRKAVTALLGKKITEEKLVRLTQISFPVLIKILNHVTTEFFDFLINENSADLLNYFQVIYPNLLNTADEKKPIDILEKEDFLYLKLLSRYYKYFKKAGFTIPKILQTTNETLIIVKDWLATHEYLFETWTGKEIAKFIKLIHLRDSQRRERNTDIFLATLPKARLLKDSQGKVIIFKVFKKLIESKISLYMKAESCELLYQKLGLEKLKQCSQTEFIINHFLTNLLRELSNLTLDQLTQVLTNAQGNIEVLKQLTVQLTEPMELLPAIKPLRKEHSASMGFFPAGTRKRSREQVAIKESPDTDKTPRFGGKLEEN